MKKIIILTLSLVVVLCLGFAVQVENVQAAQSKETMISVASEEIFVTKVVPFTRQQSMWVTETRNGKTYSGYIYNRGFSDGTGNYSFFSGYLKIGPYAPTVLKLEE
ncbi:hypothetical protein [Psychrobacillus psychrodurans]|uniref:hypothetical protein n=1 Tax=Psychrobacillus psychrodurans TaxID=126157 RepID=UPI0008E3DA05|nr:hypothetical protein [Psychrobacillus psychrodurans]MCZ8539708.1 hypothetical protein [Psychrobacillus psychrodurans]SFM93983.1 hypothetical protein SAMN05421832_109139 [Psychrobacillus psychrodurans]